MQTGPRCGLDKGAIRCRYDPFDWRAGFNCIDGLAKRTCRKTANKNRQNWKDTAKPHDVTHLIAVISGG
ncbi:hypothetical protein OEG86_10660 [Hoeflea alexandrii]|uniref:hypothetical protein n=1 Tax=Hoeflea alexandrii TaxID=288436 RepID=UPI002271506D|nr:hypothetical protein [Hoeflea alexandrii]MCY0152617.1 hypothetical protein [Hoeflea alexandrii]